jgi:acyl carrier protein
MTIRKETLHAIIEIIEREWPGNVPDEGITESTKLFYEGVCLDSIDGVTLVLSIEERFRVEIDPGAVPPVIFESVGALGAFVESWQRTGR